jgi:hypothetical protein
VRASEFLLELGNFSYEMPSRWYGVEYGSTEKTGVLPDGRKLTITIDSQSGVSVINFYIDDSQNISGKGDAFKIFSTVVNSVADYVRKYKPNYIVFTSSEEEPSRIRLYDKFVSNIHKTLPSYKNVTDNQSEWHEDLDYILDDFQDMRDQKVYVLKKTRKDHKLSETPLQSYDTIGDFDKPGPFRGPDKKLVPHPTNILKTQRFLEQTPYDFRLFFSNIPGTGKYSEHGPMDANQLKQIFGDQADQIINGSDDAITVVFVGNKGDAKVPLTPWIIAHRFGHAIQAGVRENRQWSAWGEAENHFFSQVNQMLEEYYGKIAQRGYGTSAPMKTDLTPEYNALFNAIGTQRSSRSSEIKRPYEFLYELFAQYLGTGKITLNPLPTNLGYGKKAWGTPSKYLNIKPEFRDESERADATDMLANDMGYMFDDVLSSSVGKIFVM